MYRSLMLIQLNGYLHKHFGNDLSHNPLALQVSADEPKR